ncbi:MAG: M20/M25/M40 family metallo-hydrolase, partial [Clostridia bacterium]|nr:M20/M25/M40 family metallo-hydrolase [Clostridia bacterium]
MEYIIRDHDLAEAERRCEFMKKVADYLNIKYGEGTVRVEIIPSYRNMKEVIEANPQVIDIVMSVYEEMGVNPDTAPIRGGTDGANLSFMGLPCPNLGVGGHNFHGVKEFAVVEDMDKVVDLLVRISKKVAEI